MRTRLYQFQKDAILKLHSGCILAGGVGTGKSITSLAYFLSRECKHKAGKNANGDTYKPLPGSPDLYIITTAENAIHLSGSTNLTSLPYPLARILEWAE